MEYNLIVNQKKNSIDTEILDQGLKAEIGNRIYDASFINISDHQILLEINGKIYNAFVCNNKGRKTIIVKGRSYDVADAGLLEQSSSTKKTRINTTTIVASPMPAMVISVLTEVGDKVIKGQGLVIVSAMKMETTLFAPFDGTVSKVNTKEGDKVMPADILVDIDKDGEDICQK
jgi:biotin carboxyl carrier protein